jgi:PDZ domain
MSGPKHLWSGDWENESDDAAAQTTRRPRPRDPDPEPVAAPAPAPRPAPRAREPRRARRAVRPWVLPALLGVVLIAAAAYGVTRLGGSSSSASQGNPTAELNKPKLMGSTAPVRWLGMEIITASPGVPVVETVRAGSNGDKAGLEPGDMILLVNNRPVGTSGSIATAIKGMHSGDHVPLEITNGGAMFQVVATLAAPPSPYP